MNKLEPDDIEWKGLSFWSFENYHYAVYRNEKYKIQREVITNISKLTGDFSKHPKVYYFIDGCDKEMTDLQDVCDTWNELHDFDDPNNEIVWIKKIVPVIKLNP
jgi:hypothetical protein